MVRLGFLVIPAVLLCFFLIEHPFVPAVEQGSGPGLYFNTLRRLKEFAQACAITSDQANR